MTHCMFYEFKKGSSTVEAVRSICSDDGESLKYQEMSVMDYLTLTDLPHSNFNQQSSSLTEENPKLLS